MSKVRKSLNKLIAKGRAIPVTRTDDDKRVWLRGYRRRNESVSEMSFPLAKESLIEDPNLPTRSRSPSDPLPIWKISYAEFLGKVCAFVHDQPHTQPDADAADICMDQSPEKIAMLCMDALQTRIAAQASNDPELEMLAQLAARMEWIAGCVSYFMVKSGLPGIANNIPVQSATDAETMLAGRQPAQLPEKNENEKEMQRT